jgi:hypothetical protein
MLNFYAYNITTTQFTLKMITADGANVGTGFTISYNWIAVQMKSTASAG